MPGTVRTYVADTLSQLGGPMRKERKPSGREMQAEGPKPWELNWAAPSAEDLPFVSPETQEAFGPKLLSPEAQEAFGKGPKGPKPTPEQIHELETQFEEGRERMRVLSTELAPIQKQLEAMDAPI